MVDPISNAPRQIGPTQNRSQVSSVPAGFEVTRDGLTSTQRVEALQAAVEKLIKKEPTRDSRFPLRSARFPLRSARFPLRSDDEGNAVASDVDDLHGGSDPQWPPAQLLKLHHYLKQMEGLLVDTEV